MCVCVCVCVYIYRERERRIEKFANAVLNKDGLLKIILVKFFLCVSRLISF